MSKTNWTKEQLLAIDTRNKNIVVSASAGAGKTTVLVERIFRLVKNERFPINSILAMTFTEAAANEMKKRLSKKLQEEATVEQEPKEKRYLQEQIAMIQTANISTIHSFCLSIIQEFFYIIDLPMKRANTIMDGGMQSEATTLAKERMMRDAYAMYGDNLYDTMWHFSTRPESNRELMQTIQKLSTEANAQVDKEAWFNQILASYDNTSLNNLPPILLEHYLSYFKSEALILNEILEEMYENLDFGDKKVEEKEAAFMQKYACLPAFNEAMESNDYQAIQTHWRHIAKQVSPASTNNEVYTKLRKSMDALEDRVLAKLYDEDDLMMQNETLKPIIEVLITLCKSYQAHYEQIKQDLQCLDFDDMEHFAYEILTANNNFVANILKERFNEIMVDEFQDTNPLQDSIVNLVAKHNNVFRVGDVKQSIYGFRQARPQIMKERMEHPGEHDAVLYLGNNFRSKQAIVDFNNELFDSLMNHDRLDSSYTEHDTVKTGIEKQKENSAPIEFRAIFHNDIKEENDLRDSKNEIKADYIANEIIRLKELHKYDWKDFCILGRNNSLKDIMKNTFDSYNIPYFIEAKSGFYSSTSVQLVISMLNLLVDSKDDIACSAVLTSPFFQVSYEDLAILHQNRKDKSFYDYLTQHKALPSFQEFLTLQEEHKDTSLQELLIHIFEFNNFYRDFTTKQDKTNLDLFYDIAVSFEENSGGGIQEFLEFLSKQDDKLTGEAVPVDKDEDVVRVMTIHQSKGLEFPVVFLFSKDSIVGGGKEEPYVMDCDLGIALSYINPEYRAKSKTLQEIAIEHKQKMEKITEEMRVLYVATTRAKEKMIIVDTIKNEAAYEKLHNTLRFSDIYNMAGYTSWILQYFLTTQSNIFKCERIDDYWDTTVQPKPSIQNNQIPSYQYLEEVVEENSASKQKQANHYPSFEAMNYEGMAYGTNLHTMVEFLGAHDTIDDSTIQSVADELHFDIRPSDYEKLKQLYANPNYQQMMAMDQVFYELPYLVTLDNKQVHGFMDYVAMDDKQIAIVDFKTDSKNEKELVEAYNEQLALYKQALALLYPKHEIHTYIYAFYLNQMIQLS